ncbi:MAG: hypothetical protein VYC34_12350 [Planctomycetota bacterium]|nr:hypothetical protein [Planctomycetota bacterium]
MTRRTDTRFSSRAALLAAAALAILVAAPGCNIVAPVYLLVAGPPKVQAVTELDSSRPTVIYVDDPASTMPRRSLRNLIAQTAEETILQKKLIKKDLLYSNTAAMRVASADRYGDPMSVVAIGRAVGAEVVISVVMETWTLSSDGATLAPRARARVKIIDAKNNARIWPPGDAAGHLLSVDLPQATGAAPETRAELNNVQIELARVTGVGLARLFFTHEKDELSGALDD